MQRYRAHLLRVRELARPSTKSSLIHTWTSDTRDDPWMGTSGRLLKTSYVSPSTFFAHCRMYQKLIVILGIRGSTGLIGTCAIPQIDYAYAAFSRTLSGLVNSRSPSLSFTNTL